MIYGILTLVSVSCCLGMDRIAAPLIALRLAWLALAGYVSVYGALYNTDPFFQNLFQP